MARRLGVEIVGDASNLERAYLKAKVATRRFSADMKRLSRSPAVRGGGLLGGAGAVVGLERSISAASDLAEQLSKTNVVFGQSAQEIQEWSTTTASAFGISRRQALATAGSFGALFKPIGIVGGRAAQQSKALTELGADLASFYNTDVQDALDALRSGIVGESEPLRRYGVLLSETRVQQEAMAETGKKNASQLTAQEKAAARIALIFKDAKTAQGDFARTSEDVANQARIAQANIDNLKVAIGTRLIPAVTRGVTALNEFFNVLDRAPDIGMDTFKKGEGVETTLVPALAKQIQAMKKAGADSKTILKTLRQKLGGSLKADDLIAEAFVFSAKGPASTQLKARIKKAVADAAKTAKDAAAAEKKKTAKTAGQPTGVTAGQRNDWFNALIGRQVNRVQDLPLRLRPARLKAIEGEVQARQAATKDATRRLTLEDTLLGILRQQRSVQAQIGDEIKAANQALKDRADAIKSAVINRLQRRQTDILNKRALADARDQLRVARQLGGPTGIRNAARGLQDVRFDMLRARLENAPATLSKTGRFQLGTVVTINVHGVTDPDQVARKVADVLQRRGRRTTTQTRGPAAGAA